MPQKSNRLDNLQLVRAVAMLLVLIIHADFFSTKILGTPFLGGLFFPGGDGGVDLFFVLSGFIIYYIHRNDIGQKAKLLPYLAKRFARIYPLYWLVTLLIIPLHFMFPQFGTGNETQLSTIFRSLLLIPSTSAPIIHAAWTLIYEVLFYILFGSVIYYGIKKMRLFIAGLLLMSVGAWFYTLNRTELFQSSIFYVFFSYHNFEFLLGCFGAYLVLRREIRISRQLLTLGVFTFSSMIILEFIQGRALYSLRLFGYGIPAFLIIMSLSSLEIYNRLDFSNKWYLRFLLLLGDASFSIYLTHQILISGIGRTLQSLNLVNTLGPIKVIIFTLILTIVMGITFHLLIEKPLISFTRRKLLH